MVKWRSNKCTAAEIMAQLTHMLLHGCGYALGHDTRAMQGWLGHKKYPAHGALYGIEPYAVQGFLARLLTAPHMSQLKKARPQRWALFLEGNSLFADDGSTSKPMLTSCHINAHCA
jgi:hypothetical protein